MENLYGQVLIISENLLLTDDDLTGLKPGTRRGMTITKEMLDANRVLKKFLQEAVISVFVDLAGFKKDRLLSVSVKLEA
jgi:hypothetical protein